MKNEGFTPQNMGYNPKKLRFWDSHGKSKRFDVSEHVTPSFFPGRYAGLSHTATSGPFLGPLEVKSNLCEDLKNIPQVLLCVYSVTDNKYPILYICILIEYSIDILRLEHSYCVRFFEIQYIHVRYMIQEVFGGIETCTMFRIEKKVDLQPRYSILILCAFHLLYLRGDQVVVLVGERFENLGSLYERDCSLGAPVSLLSENQTQRCIYGI